MNNSENRGLKTKKFITSQKQNEKPLTKEATRKRDEREHEKHRKIKEETVSR